jgi:hypothetical protein
MRPCRRIHLCIALRRKKANPTPWTSFGLRTTGGLNLIGVDVAHGSATAAIVTRPRRDDQVVGYCNHAGAGSVCT